MTRYDNFHSRAVAWLKILLPLLALVILANLFLVARTVDPSDAIPYSEVDIEDRVREPRLTAPTWAGVTDDGAALTVAAAEARTGQDGGAAPAATVLSVQMETPDGARYDMQAGSGILDDAAQSLTVQAGVEITTSAGYRIETPVMTLALDRTGVVAPEAVQATGPVGRISAGGMAIAETAPDSGLYLLVFNQGVKLLYQPAK